MSNKRGLNFRKADRGIRNIIQIRGGQKRFRVELKPPKKPVVKRAPLRVLSVEDVIARLKERT